jgi:DNA-binding CsgD family transcriptional regulator/PAS domain-containing protein
MSSVPEGLTARSSHATQRVHLAIDVSPRPNTTGVDKGNSGRLEPVPSRRHGVKTSRGEFALDLIERIYAAAEEPRLWTVFLERLARAIRGTVTAIVCEDFRVSHPSLMAGTRLDGVLSLAYKEHFASRDASMAGEARGLRTGEVVTSQMMPPFRDPLEKRQYDELLRRLDVKHLLGGIIFRERHRMSCVSVLRPGQRGPFGDEEVALLRTLVPHLQRALELQAKLAEQRCERAAAMETLDGVPAGILLLDRCGTALVVNRAASEMLAAKDGLTLGPGGLTAATREETSALRRLIAGAAGATGASGPPAGRVLAISRPSLRRSFCVLVKPLNEAARASGRSRPAVAVFVIDPDRRRTADGGVLQKLYGFTPAQSRVAAELMQGESVEEAARDLDVSLNTARTHVKHLFEKTDTHSHRELVRLLLCSSCCSAANLTPRNTRHDSLPQLA